MPSSKVIEMCAVTAELCGRTFSPAAAAVFAGDLDGFDEAAVLAALTRCRKEVRGVLTTQDVTSRIDDGRPGVEQAWAMMPHDEDTSVVWSDEMAEAHGTARPLLEQGDRVGARMAFKETYAKLVSDARDQRKPANWSPSFGNDMLGRQRALIEAVNHKRMDVERALTMLPPEYGEALLLQTENKGHPMLAAPDTKAREKVAAILLEMKGFYDVRNAT
jgi:hypothetical protein